jgi:hypothetical protein
VSMSVPYTTGPVAGGAPEKEVALDIAKHAAWIAPILVLACGAVWGLPGAAGALYGIAIVVVNFLLSAALITVTARISLALMMGAVLFGYLLRLGLVLVAFLAVRNADWVNLWALGLTVIVTHLGLLFWELRYVSASLAFPGLKPSALPGSSK